MADLAVITPSRARPERLLEMIKTCMTYAEMEIEFWIGLDQDDESDYTTVIDEAFANGASLYVARLPRRSLSEWTNLLARRALDSDGAPRYLASLGDDHRPRTKGWDRLLVEAIEHRIKAPGFAYGNDLLQGRNLPTAWVVSSSIVNTLGWMMLPSAKHLFVDNAVKSLGEATGRLIYIPNVIIEHEHPYAGKSKFDDSYRASNNSEAARNDRNAYLAWLKDGFDADAATVRSLHYF